MFSCGFCEIFANTFFTEHLWKTASKLEPNPKHILLQEFTRKLRANFKTHKLIFNCIKKYYQVE